MFIKIGNYKFFNKKLLYKYYLANFISINDCQFMNAKSYGKFEFLIEFKSSINANSTLIAFFCAIFLKRFIFLMLHFVKYAYPMIVVMSYLDQRHRL